MVEQIPKQVGIRALKAHLSTYVKWAEAGHDITITDHGRPAARLVAPDPTSADVMPESLTRASPSSPSMFVRLRLPVPWGSRCLAPDRWMLRGPMRSGFVGPDVEAERLRDLHRLIPGDHRAPKRDGERIDAGEV